jgi:hypothetical protein
MKKLLVLALAATTILVGPSVARADKIIDDYNDAAQQLLVQTVGGGLVSSTRSGAALAPAIVIGGERAITIPPIAGPGGAQASARVNVGFANLSQDGGVTAQFNFIYDGIGGAGLPAADRDLTAVGNRFALLASRDANVVLTGKIIVEDFLGNDGEETFLFPNDDSFPPDTGIMDVPFTAAGFAGVDFTNVKSITLLLNAGGIANADFAIDDFRILNGGRIPEPATLAILTGSLLGLGGVRLLRRRRHSA